MLNTKAVGTVNEELSKVLDSVVYNSRRLSRLGQQETSLNFSISAAKFGL